MQIYCDGSGGHNCSASGYGIIAVDDNVVILECGNLPRHVGSQGAELVAMLQALRLASECGGRVIIYSDSQYTVNAITKWYRNWERNGWKKADGNPVKHAPIIQKMVGLKRRDITVRWVRGHAGIMGNEIADTLANIGRNNVGDGKRKTITADRRKVRRWGDVKKLCNKLR